MIEIWEPKWKTREVLIACHKVSSHGKNYIRFTKCKSLPYVYEIDAEDITSCPVINNGRIECFAVPLSMLRISTQAKTCETEPSMKTLFPEGAI